MNSRAALARGLHDDSSRTPSRVVDLSGNVPTVEVVLPSKAADGRPLSERRPSGLGGASITVARRLSATGMSLFDRRASLAASGLRTPQTLC